MLIQTLDDRVVYLDDNGSTRGEVVFSRGEDGVVDITRLHIDERERGRSLHTNLMRQTVRHLRFRGERARVSCPYARDWFERNPTWADVLV